MIVKTHATRERLSHKQPSARQARRLTRPNARRLAGKLLCLSLLPLVLAGCKHGGEGTAVAGWSLVNPEQRHPILVTQEPAHLNLRIGSGSQGLSPSQRSEVMQFTGHYRAGDAGNSRLVISAPSGSSNEMAAMAAVDEVRDLLLNGGFNESAIAVEAYSSEGHAPAPVRISYMRFVAEGPTCGRDWSENLGVSHANTGHPNFDCAGQQNLAAMIANPADLLGPRSSSPRYGERRDQIMDKWTKGEITGAEKSDDERARVEK